MERSSQINLEQGQIRPNEGAIQESTSQQGTLPIEGVTQQGTLPPAQANLEPTAEAPIGSTPSTSSGAYFPSNLSTGAQAMHVDLEQEQVGTQPSTSRGTLRGRAGTRGVQFHLVPGVTRRGVFQRVIPLGIFEMHLTPDSASDSDSLPDTVILSQSSQSEGSPGYFNEE